MCSLDWLVVALPVETAGRPSADMSISNLFTQLDTNGDGVVDEAEWLAGYSKWKALVAGKKVPPPPSPPASWPAQPL